MIFLLFVVPFVSALPPSFHVFSGSVTCENSENPNGDQLSVTITNGTDTMQETATISNEVYSLVVSADTGYNVSFYASGTFLDSVDYQPYSITEMNFSLSSGHSFCTAGSGTTTGTTGGSSGGGGGGGGSLKTNTCGDGDCDLGETCSGCPEDCGSCDSWELSGSSVNLDEDDVVEVVSTGGNYELILDGATTPFNIASVSDESLIIVMDGQSYTISLMGSQELDKGEHNLQISYLDNANGKAKLSFRKILERAVTPYPVNDVLYFVGGVVLFGVLIFFFVRWLNKHVQGKSISTSKKKGLLAGPRK